MTGFLVRPWGVVLLVLLAVVSIFLACGSGVAWYRADRERQNYLTLAGRARGLTDSLAAVRCVPALPGQPVRVFPVPRDTLRRAK